ncbi:Protein associated with UVRAG as autophagy enhancer [Galemys pyrenaicus]|uniref:Protein associated with UVRAG as autophagy enhancer n=1 Tax=Galemys pyrenaicus TaxID=202257 RepID=A0A8J6B2N5_GALPY|nr:Protein associated with UVRAG as autophagy enhancer [Galemys pyrenaicus]
MVSQSRGQQDSPLCPWEGVSYDSHDAEVLPILSYTDHSPHKTEASFTRPKAAWINPLCAEQQLQDMPPQVPTAADAAAPLDPSRSPLGYSLVKTSLTKDTVGSVGSCLDCDLGEKSSDSSLTSMEERADLLGRSPCMSLLSCPRILVTSPCPETGCELLQFSHQTTSTDDGAVQVCGKNASLSPFSPEAFVLPVDVEKENAHFYVADMLISVMEKMKYIILSQQHTENWSVGEVSGPLGNDQADSEVTFSTNIKQESGSSASSDSGYEGKTIGAGAKVKEAVWGQLASCAVLHVSPVIETPIYCDVVKETCKYDLDEFVTAELGEFSNTTENRGCSHSSSKSVICEPNFSSAELLAKELYQAFRKCWMLSEDNYQLASSLNAAGSVVVSEEHIQKDLESSVDVVHEIKFKSRIRGTEDWAPPRFQIIFNIHPPLKRDLVIAAQNFFCAGCGTSVEPKFVKRLRYCEYLGRYFCDCCHTYMESCIPARILTAWDFKKYYVSNFSKWLLDSIWYQPVFNLVNINRGLYAKAKELDRLRETQEQLFHIKKLLKTCRFAESALKEFEQVPRHLTDERHLFSLEDLVRVKKGLLVSSFKDLLKVSLAHVASCEVRLPRLSPRQQGQADVVRLPQSSLTIPEEGGGHIVSR